MPTFGLYLINDHPLHHHIMIHYPATDPDPTGYCIDCDQPVDVRYIHPGWLDVTELKIDLEAVAGVDDDPATTAYAKGMVGSINTAIENYRKARTKKESEEVKATRAAMRRRPFLKQVDYVRRAVKLLGRGSTKSIFGKYKEVAYSEGETRHRTYRAVFGILSYLVDQGEVEVEQENLGRRGTRNIWQVKDDNGTGAHTTR